MEHAPLRPVPARPAGPIDPATALRDVSSWLPILGPEAARALALVVLAERPRAEVASTLRVSEEELGELLAEARKELRQTLVVLGGTGWCERAEGLISDRLDGPLADRDARRLDVHLRNCSRCVEHERRLVQATDALVMGAGGRAPSPGAAPAVTPLAEATPSGAEAPTPSTEAPKAATPSAEAPEAPAPSAEAPEAATPPGEAATPSAEPARADDRIEEAASEEAAPPGEEAAPPGEEAAPPGEEAGVPAEPALPPAEVQVAAAAEVLVAARTRRQIAGAVVWNSLIALAILLALATIALTIAGIMGAQL
jgi:hypothetical protein